jgi:Tol biopolymer transport system component
MVRCNATTLTTLLLMGHLLLSMGCARSPDGTPTPAPVSLPSTATVAPPTATPVPPAATALPTVWVPIRQATSVPGGSAALQADGDSYDPAISADGRWLVFASDASNLVPDDTNGVTDVFVRDRLTGQTTRVSVASDGAQADGSSGLPCISADGRWIAFVTSATNLGLEGAGVQILPSIYLHDRETGKTELVSVSLGGESDYEGTGAPAISADGRYVAFASLANNLVPGDTNRRCDVFVRDCVVKKTVRVSVASDGSEADLGTGYMASISADGRWVVFESEATNLAPGQTQIAWRLYVHDQLTGQTEMLPLPPEVEPFVGSPVISGDGQWVAFVAAPLVHQDGLQRELALYLYDRKTEGTERVALLLRKAHAYIHNQGFVALSYDGRWAAFVSEEGSAADDEEGDYHILIYDRLARKLQRLGIYVDGEFRKPNGPQGYLPAISLDGRWVAFPTKASDLVPGDTNGRVDVFVYDRETGFVTLDSVPGAYKP